MKPASRIHNRSKINGFSGDHCVSPGNRCVILITNSPTFSRVQYSRIYILISYDFKSGSVEAKPQISLLNDDLYKETASVWGGSLKQGRC